jgi:hypothetical protein
VNGDHLVQFAMSSMRTELIEMKNARIGAELVQARELAEFLSVDVG